MPELDFAVLAEAARVADNLLFVHAGGWDTMAGPESGVHVINLAMRVLFTRAECGRLHRVELVIHGADGQRLATVSGVMNPVEIPGLPMGWKVPAMVTFRVPVSFPAHGEYAIELLINDSSVKSLPLRTVPVPPSISPQQP